MNLYLYSRTDRLGRRIVARGDAGTREAIVYALNRGFTVRFSDTVFEREFDNLFDAVRYARTQLRLEPTCWSDDQRVDLVPTVRGGD